MIMTHANWKTVKKYLQLEKGNVLKFRQNIATAIEVNLAKSLPVDKAIIGQHKNKN